MVAPFPSSRAFCKAFVRYTTIVINTDSVLFQEVGRLRVLHSHAYFTKLSLVRYTTSCHQRL